MLPLPSHLLPVHSVDLTGQVQRLGERPFALGGFADIFKGFLNGSNTVVAVKVIRCTYPTDPIQCGVPKKLRREIEVWSTLDHPHIVPFFGTTTDFDRGYGFPCLVTPYFSNGNVMTYLKTHPHANKHSIITQLASGLDYLHDHSIVHGDIKGNNILVDDDGSARLTDFGLARALDKSGFSSGTTSCTLRFLAAELFEQDSGSASTAELLYFTKESDVWAFGMTVLQVLSELRPFPRIWNDFAVITFVIGGGRPQHGDYPGVSPGIWNVLERCWDDAKQRTSIKQLYKFFPVPSL